MQVVNNLRWSFVVKTKAFNTVHLGLFTVTVWNVTEKDRKLIKKRNVASMH